MTYSNKVTKTLVLFTVFMNFSLGGEQLINKDYLKNNEENKTKIDRIKSVCFESLEGKLFSKTLSNGRPSVRINYMGEREVDITIVGEILLKEATSISNSILTHLSLSGLTSITVSFFKSEERKFVDEIDGGGKRYQYILNERIFKADYSLGE